MRFVIFAIVLVEACRAPAPLAAPSSLIADFEQIPKDRCTPELDGMFVSWDGGQKLVQSHDSSLIDLNAQLAAERLKTRSSESDKQWASWGKVGAVVVSVLTVFGVISFVRAVTK